MPSTPPSWPSSSARWRQVDDALTAKVRGDLQVQRSGEGGPADSRRPDDAAARLHRYANGLPRALNNAATAALMAAAADGKALVDDDTCAKKAIAELTRTCP